MWNSFKWNKKKGSKKDVKFDFNIVATAVLNTKIDSDILKTILPKLSKEELACIKFEPKLITKNYSKLCEDSLLQKAVITKEGSPRLKIEDIEIDK